MKVSRLLAAVTVAFSATLAAQQGGRIGPSGSEVAGAAVGVGAAVTVVVVLAVRHSHHVMSGCVVSGPYGIELHTSDSRAYALEGNAANLTVGDRVKIRGSKVGKAKGATGLDVFRVEKLNKDYGTCHVEQASIPGGAH